MDFSPPTEPFSADVELLRSVSGPTKLVSSRRHCPQRCNPAATQNAEEFLEPAPAQINDEQRRPTQQSAGDVFVANITVVPSAAHPIVGIMCTRWTHLME
jgi:hypothetical protein